MKLYFENNGVFEEITPGNAVNVFGSLNGYVGSEKTTKFKIVADTLENLTNVCCRLFNDVVVSGVSNQKYLIPFNSDKNKLVLQNDFNIKYQFENTPDKNGVVYITPKLSGEESLDVPGTFPYKEYVFTITIFVTEKTIEDILGEDTVNVSLEFIYNE